MIMSNNKELDKVRNRFISANDLATESSKTPVIDIFNDKNDPNRLLAVLTGSTKSVMIRTHEKRFEEDEPVIVTTVLLPNVVTQVMQLEDIEDWDE